MKTTISIAISGLAALALLACESKTDPGGGELAAPAERAASAPESVDEADAPAPAPVAAAPEARGFVVSTWYDDLPEVDPSGCPDGMNLTESQYYEVDMEAFRKAIKETSYKDAQEKFFPPDACRDPTAQKDPGFKTFDGAAEVVGLDLDGVDSKRDDGSACAHDDFTSPDGTTGIDAQHWRLMGCTKGYQPDGQIDRLYRSGNMIKEGFPILIELSGVDDTQNDDEVEMRIYSSEDSVTLDASGEVMRDLSLKVHPERKYWSDAAKGRIENGVLTTDPIDVRLRFKQQVIDGEFYYRDVQVRADMRSDGTIDGILGFYWDADNFYTTNNDHYIGENHTGRVAAETRGYMCAGIYHAIQRMADGHPDPETGRCTSISAAMHFSGTPAFLIKDESA